MRTLMMVTALLLASCGGSDSVSIDEYADTFRDSLCRFLVKCGDVENLATCRKINIGIDLFLSASARAAIDMGKIDYDGGNAQSCLDAFASRSCDVTSESNRAAPASCQGITRGTVHGDAACASSDECISLICDIPSCNMACCMGTCFGDVAPGNAKIGQSCQNAFCEAASFCDEATLLCTALKPQGAFCANSDECRFGLDCDQNAVCNALPAPGEACTGQCRDVGTTCSRTSRTCVKVVLAGGACTPQGGECSPLYGCDATGHCSAGPAVGAPCPDNFCGDDRAFCDTTAGTPGTCTLPKANGAACQFDSQCDGHYCDAATRVCAAEPICI